MLQPVPVLFQRFRIVPGDSLRQERDKGERHHRCLSEEARIIEPKFSKRTRGGRLALVIFGANSTTGAHIASPLLRAREAEPSCGYVGDRAVRIQERLQAAAVNLVPAQPRNIPYDGLRRVFVGIRMTFLSNRQRVNRRHHENHQ